jgi:hypothetical protein
LFNNDYAGYSIGTAERFRELVGAARPSFDNTAFGTLFG